LFDYIFWGMVHFLCYAILTSNMIFAISVKYTDG